MVGILALIGYFISARGDLRKKTVCWVVICHEHQFTALNIEALVST